MEFTSLNGSKINNIELTENEINFTTDLFEIEANIKVTGIKEITENDEVVKDLTSISTIETVDLEVIDIEEDTFSEAVITTEDGDVFRLVGDMKGTILNMEDFEHLIDEDEYEDEDEDEDEDE